MARKTFLGSLALAMNCDNHSHQVADLVTTLGTACRHHCHHCHQSLVDITVISRLPTSLSSLSSVPCRYHCHHCHQSLADITVMSLCRLNCHLAQRHLPWFLRVLTSLESPRGGLWVEGSDVVHPSWPLSHGVVNNSNRVYKT